MAETAADEAQEAQGVKIEKYLIFSILGKFYCFPSHLIGEITHFDAVYPLPLLPPYVLGVINRYSAPYALFDTGLFILNKACARKKVLVLKDEIDRCAFLIDDVTGIADIEENILNRIEGANDGVCASFNMDGNEVFVLDAAFILKRVTQEIYV